MIVLLIKVSLSMIQLLLNNISKLKQISIISLLVMSLLVFSVILLILVLFNLCLMTFRLLLTFKLLKIFLLTLCKLSISFLPISANALKMIHHKCSTFLKRRKIAMKQSGWVLFRNQLTPILLQSLILTLTNQLQKLSESSTSSAEK